MAISWTLEFNLDNAPADLTFTDTAAWTGSAKGLLQIKDPTGSLVYKNAGYDTDNFGAPDTDTAVSMVFTGQPLPLDSNGDVLQGTYTVDYKTQETGVPPTTTTSDSYVYCYTQPVASLTVSSSCVTSILTSTDATDYDVNCNGSVIVPTITRTHTLKYPLSILPTPPADIVANAVTVTAGPNIYTKTWTITLSSVLQYTLIDGLIINDTVTGATTHDVECDSCLCNIIACLEAIRQRWLTYIGTNKVEADRYYLILSKTYSALWGYIIAERCGEDTSTYCTEITTLINSVQACCTATTSEISEEVIPIAGGGGGTTVYYNVWYSGAGVPGSGLGNNNDYYVCTTAGGGALLGDLYKKIAGTWTLLFNMQGATGSAGQDGVAVLYNPQGTGWLSGVTGLEENLITWNLPANTLVTKGDYLIVRFYIKIGLYANYGYDLNVYLGTTQFATFLVVPTLATDYILECKISRDASAKEWFIATLESVGLPNLRRTITRAFATEDLTTILGISFRTQIYAGIGSPPMVAGQLQLNEFEVTKYLI